MTLHRDPVAQPRRYRLAGAWLIPCLAVLMFCVTCDTYAQSSLVFGILPVQSPVALFRRFAPLRDYLTQHLHTTIRLETSRDFPQFARRTAGRQYDIVFTAPHMVMPALDSGHYQLAATFDRPLAAVIVVKRDSHIHDTAALNGKRIATPPRQAIVTMVGREFLQQQGVLAHKQTQLYACRSHNAAYRAVLAGDADAAIISNFIYQRSRGQHMGLRQIATSKPFPGMSILVAKDLPDPIKYSIESTFINMAKHPQGRKLLSKISQPGYEPGKTSAFASMHRFADHIEDRHSDK